MTRLRTETEAEHKAMEEALDLLDPASTLSDYVATLQAFEAFVKGWEETGHENCPPKMLPAFMQRQRHSLLQADLKHFGVSPLVDTPVLPSLAQEALFLGAMYVMEGSTLGGQLISRHLEKAYGLENGKGYSFFQGHGADTGRLWKDFCSQLEDQAQEQDPSLVVEGARNMFLAFRQWIDIWRTSRGL